MQKQLAEFGDRKRWCRRCEVGQTDKKSLFRGREDVQDQSKDRQKKIQKEKTEEHCMA